MSKPEYRLGDYNDKNYCLYPHFHDYFVEMLRQLNSQKYDTGPMTNIVDVINNLVFDIQKGTLQYLEELEAAVIKIQQLDPQNWRRFQNLVPCLKSTSFQTLKCTKAVNISRNFYKLFEGLSLTKYLYGLNTQIVFVNQGMRLIDGNLDKLSRLAIPNLEGLLLQQNQITVEGVKLFTKNSNWIFLRHLNLNKNDLNNDGLRQLTNPQWKYLRQLELHGNPFGDAGVEFLCKYSNWPHLERLDLRSRRSDNTFFGVHDGYWFCKLTSSTIQSLLSKNWKLQKLQIYIGDKYVVVNQYQKLKEQLIEAL